MKALGAACMAPAVGSFAPLAHAQGDDVPSYWEESVKAPTGGVEIATSVGFAEGLAGRFDVEGTLSEENDGR
jgi:hypothetical protein